MSVARPIQCMLSRRLATAARPAAAAAITGAPQQQQTPPCRRRHHPSTAAPFHSSAPLAGRRRPRFKNIRAVELGLTTEEKVEEYGKRTFPGYSEEEMAVLRERYTPQQLAALEAGEEAIDPRDLTIQARLRRDPYRLPYLDDFSKVMPIIDRRPKNPAAPKHPDPNARWMTPSEESANMFQWMCDLVPPELQHLLESPAPVIPEADQERLKEMSPAEAEREMRAIHKAMGEAEAERMKPLYEHLDRIMPVESLKFFGERSTMNDNNAASNSAMAPGLGNKLRGVDGLYAAPVDPADDGLDDMGVYQDVKRRTGLKVSEILGLRTKILVTRFVDNQTRLGKIRSVWALAISGNGDGRLGVGEAKSVEPAIAHAKARLLSVQNMQPIRRYENRTIFGRVRAKVGATIVEIATRPPGFGLRASHRLFEIFRAVGLRDIAAKMPRGRNPMNSVKACVQALMSQKDPNELAVGRGKKLVDVRKVYYGGNVY